MSRQQEPSSERSPGLLVGRYFGIPVYFSPSWLVLAAVITLSWSSVVRDSLPHLSKSESYLVAFIGAILLALSVLAHELGHCVVSVALGLKVRRVVLVLLGGVSEIENEPQRPSHEYLVAVAGPLVSLILAAAGAAGYEALEPDSVPRLLVVMLTWSNLGVMIFNLLPGLPLDGGRLLRAGVWQLTSSQLTGTRAAAWGGRIIAIVVVVGSLVLQYLNGGGQIASTMIALLLGLFIWASAGQALKMAELQESVPQLRLDELVRPILTVTSDTSISEGIRRAREARVGALVVTDGDGKPLALVSEASAAAVPENRRPWTSLADVARPLEPGLKLPDHLAGEQLLDALRMTPGTEYLVVGRNDDTVGVLVTADVAKALGGAPRKPPNPESTPFSAAGRPGDPR